MLEYCGEDLHIVALFSPLLWNLSNLNFDNFGGIFTQIFPIKFAYNFLKYHRTPVLDEALLDSFLLVSAELVGQTEHLAHGLFDRLIKVDIRVYL